MQDMLRIGLVVIMAGAFLLCHGQDPAQYMAPVWEGADVHKWTIAYEVRSEPAARSKQVFAPLILGGKTYLPAIAGELELQNSPSTLQPVRSGLGGFLERFEEVIPAWEWAAGTANGGRMVVAMRTGKKNKSRSRIGEWDASGTFSAFPWSDGSANDFRPMIAGENRLYFHSDRPGGSGGMDIWYSERENGVWKPPVNFAEVNSPGHDLNPRIDLNGDLVFSSDSRPEGKGGFDLFRWNGIIISPLPYPFNSKFDDIDFQPIEKGGFWVSSNRPTETLREQGPLQLFRFTPKKPLALSTIHARSGKSIPDQKLQVSALDQNWEGKTDEQGRLNLYLDAGEWVDVAVCRDLFDTAKVKRLTTGSLGTLSLTERNYWQLNLQIKENGLAANRPASVKVYRQEQLVDSTKTDSKGMLSKDLLPNSAYRFVTTLPGYPANSLTITTGATGKNLYSRSISFGWNKAEYLRWQLRNPDGKPVEGVRVAILKDREEVRDVYPTRTDSRGFGGAALVEDNAYTLLAMSEGMIGFQEWKTRPHAGKIDTSDVIMEMVALKPGAVIGSFLCTINPFELQAGKVDGMHIILRILEANPELKLEVGVHTESRGNAAENLRRSKQAAEFAMDFFVGKGIPKNRLTFKGYGETQVRNRCIEGVNCTEEEHLVNNRLEFRVN